MSENSYPECKACDNNGTYYPCLILAAKEHLFITKRGSVATLTADLTSKSETEMYI